jgi:PAS domain-containing protein
MRAKPSGEPARRVRKLLAFAGLPGALACLLLAALAWSQGRAAFRAELEARAHEQQRMVEALLEGPGDAEAVLDPLPRDVAGARERVRSLVAALDWPAGTVRLVEAGSSGPDGLQASDATLTFRRPVGGSGLMLEHRIEPAALRRAGLSAAAPWLLAVPLLFLTLALADRLVRRRILVPAVAALEDLAAAAAGRPSAAAADPGWARPWVEEGRRAARAQADRIAAGEAAEATLTAALGAVEEGVAVLDAEGRLVFANAAFGRAVAGAGQEPPGPGRSLEPALRAALARAGGLRELALGSGGRLLLLGSPASLPPVGGTPAPSRTKPPPSLGGPRLASMVQEVAEALALVARQAVLLHELASEPTSRARAGELRRAVERCTRAIAPLLAPPRALRPDAVAHDRLGAAGGEREAALLEPTAGPPRG